jgi:hypothetical protein
MRKHFLHSLFATLALTQVMFVLQANENNQAAIEQQKTDSMLSKKPAQELVATKNRTAKKEILQKNDHDQSTLEKFLKWIKGNFAQALLLTGSGIAASIGIVLGVRYIIKKNQKQTHNDSPFNPNPQSDGITQPCSERAIVKWNGDINSLNQKQTHNDPQSDGITQPYSEKTIAKWNCDINSLNDEQFQKVLEFLEPKTNIPPKALESKQELQKYFSDLKEENPQESSYIHKTASYVVNTSPIEQVD